MRWYNEDDASLTPILGKKVGIIGYGNQGQAQALNLRDSGVNVLIAQRGNSINHALAVRHNWEIVSIKELCNQCDFIQILLPDETHKKIFEKEIRNQIKPGSSLCFSHGFSVHMGCLNPPDNINVLMVSPKAIALTVRENYLKNKVTAGVFAIHQDATGEGKDLALSYAKAIGLCKGALFETTFAEECESDLFSEQAVICGGVVQLVRYGFEVLVAEGIPAELAYIECLHELKIITDILYRGGISSLVRGISNTAEYGMYESGEKIISPEIKKRMHEVFSSIRNGDFAKKFETDSTNGFSQLQEIRKNVEKHPIESIGKVIRERIFTKILKNSP